MTDKPKRDRSGETDARAERRFTSRFAASPLGQLLTSRGKTAADFAEALDLPLVTVLRYGAGDVAMRHWHVYPIARALGVLETIPNHYTPQQRDEAVTGALRAFMPHTRDIPAGLTAIAARREMAESRILTDAGIRTGIYRQIAEGWVSAFIADRLEAVGVTRDELAAEGITIYSHGKVELPPENQNETGDQRRERNQKKARAIAHEVYDGRPVAEVAAKVERFARSLHYRGERVTAIREGERVIRGYLAKVAKAAARPGKAKENVARAVARRREKRQAEAAQRRADKAAADARAAAESAQAPAPTEPPVTPARPAPRPPAKPVPAPLSPAQIRDAEAEAQRLRQFAAEQAVRAEERAEAERKRAAEMELLNAQIAFRRAAREAAEAANAPKPTAKATTATAPKPAQTGHEAGANAPAVGAPAYRVVPAPKAEPNPVPLLRPDPAFAPRPNRPPRQYPKPPTDAPIDLGHAIVTRQATAHVTRHTRAAEDAESQATRDAAAAFAAMFLTPQLEEVQP